MSVKKTEHLPSCYRGQRRTGGRVLCFGSMVTAEGYWDAGVPQEHYNDWYLTRGRRRGIRTDSELRSDPQLNNRMRERAEEAPLCLWKRGPKETADPKNS